MARPAKKQCELCRREVADITLHHLFPRSRHRNKKLRRQYDLAELQSRVAYLCSSCHKFIHSQISEKQMAEHYNTVDRLLSHDKIHEYSRWIAKKPAGFRCRSLRTIS